MSTYQLLGLVRRGKLLFGFRLKPEEEKEQKQEIYIETGNIIKFPSKLILYDFRLYAVADNVKSMKKALKSYKETMFIQTIDLQILWDCLDKGVEYSFSDIVNFYFAQPTEAQIGSLFMALREDVIYFQLQKTLFSKIEETQVKENFQRAMAKKQNSMAEKNVLDWLNNDTTKCLDIHEKENKKILDGLIQMALEGEDAVVDIHSKRIANLLGLHQDDLLIRLEQKGLIENNINELIYRHKIIIEHPQNVLQESNEILEQPLDVSDRQSIEHPFNIAIDNKDTLEVDDAISYIYESKSKTHVVGVHISDVSYFIQQDTELDKYAMKRFATLYFPEKQYPLYPMELIEQRLKLSTKEPRAAISCIFTFDQNYQLLNYTFQKTKFHLHTRATYTDIALLEKHEMQMLFNISTKLLEGRKQHGAVIIDQGDFILRVQDNEIKGYKIDKTPLHQIIAEFMILYNTVLAEYFVQKAQIAFFRTQATPQNFIPITSDDLLLFLKAKDQLVAPLLSLSPKSHHSLGVDYYVQGTAPLRRYGDLLMQRLLTCLLQQQTTENLHLQNIIADFEKTEKIIKKVEYERNQFWLYKYLKQNNEIIYKGIITNIISEKKYTVYLPEILKEFPFFPTYPSEIDKVGDTIYLQVRHSSARTKKVQLIRTRSPFLGTIRKKIS